MKGSVLAYPVVTPSFLLPYVCQICHGFGFRHPWWQFHCRSPSWYYLDTTLWTQTQMALNSWKMIPPKEAFTRCLNGLIFVLHLCQEVYGLISCPNDPGWVYVSHEMPYSNLYNSRSKMHGRGMLQPPVLWRGVELRSVGGCGRSVSLAKDHTSSWWSLILEISC